MKNIRQSHQLMLHWYILCYLHHKLNTLLIAKTLHQQMNCPVCNNSVSNILLISLISKPGKIINTINICREKSTKPEHFNRFFIQFKELSFLWLANCYLTEIMTYNLNLDSFNYMDKKTMGRRDKVNCNEGFMCLKLKLFSDVLCIFSFPPQ